MEFVNQYFLQDKEGNDAYLACDIIPLFFNSKTKSKFETCNYCKGDLDDAEYYSIQKCFKINKNTGEYDVEYEFALCSECANILKKEISEESLKIMEKFFINLRFSTSANCLLIDENGYLQNMKTCAKTDIVWSSCEEFVIMGNFIKNSLVIGVLPLLLGQKALEEISESLSEKTKNFNDYLGKELLSPTEFWNTPVKPILI